MHKTTAKRPGDCPPTLQPIGNLFTVRAKLVLLGWPSLRAWADAHGYERVTVSYAIKSWGMRSDKEPHGGLSRAVMRDLRQTLSAEAGS